MVKSILATVVENWKRNQIKGFWEIRGEGQHFVSSKVMCWVALDRGAKLLKCLINTIIANVGNWKLKNKERRNEIRLE